MGVAEVKTLIDGLP